MNYKNIVLLFFLLYGLLVSAQNSELSLTPEELPEMFFGTWLNDNKEPIFISTSEYLIFDNKLWYYSSISAFNSGVEKARDVFQIVCSSSSIDKYKTVRVYLLDDESLYFEKDISIPSEYLVKNQDPFGVYSKNKQTKWYSSKDVISLTKKEIRFNDKLFATDFFVTAEADSFFVGYNNGSYSLFRVEKDLDGSFLYYSGRKFKKETFYQKYFILVVILLVTILFVLTYFLFKWKIALSKKKEETRRKIAEMKLKSIRSQMNPHFLFNALSAIQHLINKEDNDKANHYLTEFSQLLRLTLDKSEKGLVSLFDEIESIKKYLDLENLRFTFKYSLKIDADIDSHQIEIPAMLIQPFVENAIIHGLNGSGSDKKIGIEFKKQGNYLQCFIKDNGIGIKASKAKQKLAVKKTHYGHKLGEDRIQLINESHDTNAKIVITDLSDNSEIETGTLIEILTPLNY